MNFIYFSKIVEHEIDNMSCRMPTHYVLGH
jgi:hypothetical protein